MSTSSFTAIEQSLVALLRTSLPTDVEVTSCSPSQAATLKLKPGRPGRVNVALIRLELDQSLRTAPNRATASAPQAAFALSYLISAYSRFDSTVEGGVPHLLECALRAVCQQPVQTVALPNSAGVTTPTPISLLIQELPLEQLTSLWRALETEFRPAVICLARPMPIKT